MPTARNESGRQTELQSVVDGLQEIGQRVSSTAAAWINPSSSIVKEITPHLKRPSFQKRLLSSTSPSELLRSNLSPSEISYRQITYLPDDLLRDIPEDDGSQTYSLFQGFEASLPDTPRRLIKHKSTHRNSSSQPQGRIRPAKTPDSVKFERDRDHIAHSLEILAVRKSLASNEIREIDSKLATLTKMRGKLIEKLEHLEIQEVEATDDLQEIETKVMEARDVEDVVDMESEVTTVDSDTFDEENSAFLSQSTYGSLSRTSANKARKRKALRRKSAPILHQHYDAGSSIKSLPAHQEAITSLDFDYPFGTMVTASVDDTVRVWNLATGRCQGLLEGHIASVRCLQLEDTIVATGSTDAKVKLWDLGLSDQYSSAPPSAVSNLINKYRNSSDSDDDRSSFTAVDGRESRQSDLHQAVDCCVHTFDAHVGEVTALHFINQTLVSGSQDRTIRQWDMGTGRLLQTMDILGISGTPWTGGTSSFVDTGVKGSGDFVGALQCFEQGLAAGTADGMVRFWDLRTGAVARELTGHTGPVTALQFDDLHLVSGSLDRSVRIWDLRTGSIHDAYAYEQGITDLHFDARRIVTAAGESYAKVYDRVDGRHWGCGEDDFGDTGIIKTVKSKEGYLVGGRNDGMVGIWSI